MKKVISILLTIVMLSSFVVAVSAAQADDLAFNGVADTYIGDIGYDVYFIENTTYCASVVDGSEATGNVILPKTITFNDITYSVVSITGGAFTDCVGLESVQLPDFDGFTIVSLDGNALTNGIFVNCDQTVTVKFYDEQAAVYVYLSTTTDDIAAEIINTNNPEVNSIIAMILEFIRKIREFFASLFGK